ncbi:MAG: hypothetical protein IKM36_03720 [Oscillospiraceae bacterium]|nr:hypothetical protein [Oscillospiraceae bacterium]MBR2896508.1 hypothetical protein [Oscillospiraceae bacterium]MBR2978207.1 hypothetical protein [Oscillospiraceae bacterium]MBR3849585.1 hypothetical protein [Oscillospiraceae bacterium]
MIKELYTQAFSILMKKPVRLWGISLLGSVLGIVTSIFFAVPLGLSVAINLLLETGLVMVFLHGIRGEEVKSVQLFDCFKSWDVIKRVLAGMGWRALWLFLWCLIPVVGWIIAAVKSYSWFLVPYILVQEPDIAPTEALAVSAQRTEGKKGQIFLAYLLPTLAIWVVSFVIGLLALIPFIGVLFSIVGFVFSIVAGLLMPLFVGLVGAAIYEKLKNGAAAE